MKDTKSQFDPEKVKREPITFISGPSTERMEMTFDYVAARDYDRLLDMYRELVPLPPDPATLPTIEEMRGLLDRPTSKL